MLRSLSKESDCNSLCYYMRSLNYLTIIFRLKGKEFFTWPRGKEPDCNSLYYIRSLNSSKLPPPCIMLSYILSSYITKNALGFKQSHTFISDRFRLNIHNFATPFIIGIVSRASTGTKNMQLCIQSRPSWASRKRPLTRGKGFFASLSKQRIGLQ